MTAALLGTLVSESFEPMPEFSKVKVTTAPLAKSNWVEVPPVFIILAPVILPSAVSAPVLLIEIFISLPTPSVSSTFEEPTAALLDRRTYLLF